MARQLNVAKVVGAQDSLPAGTKKSPRLFFIVNRVAEQTQIV